MSAEKSSLSSDDGPPLNAGPTDHMSGRLRRYFAKYPNRGSNVMSVLFRRGEKDRFQRLESWIPDWKGLTVLDAGCGDGVFLSRLLHGRPRRIRLEDFLERWSTPAGKRLQFAADEVEAVTTDVRTADDASLYDIVLALGLFDYDPDWPGLLRCLLARSQGIVIADFPKVGTLHSWARRIWLGVHGIRLQTTNREGLESLFDEMGVRARIEELQLQWIARIETIPPLSVH